MDKDRLGNKIKFLMEEEVENIELSQELKDRILKYRKKTIKEKIRDFLNREVEIPLLTMVAVFTLIFLIIGVPRDILSKENVSIVNLGSSQIIIRDEGRLGKND